MTEPSRTESGEVGTSGLLLRGGRVVDPANGLDDRVDVLLHEGQIAGIGSGLEVPSGTGVVDIPSGCVVCPGFIDMHVHLREPGHEHKETVATGVAAAVAGGFTAVACMPNTEPANDDAAVTRLILDRAAEAGLARVYPVGAVTKGRNGQELAPLAELRGAGCVAVSDDGRSVATPILMRRALEYAAMCDMVVIDQCQEITLTEGGVAHEGYRAACLGLRGMPAAAEEIAVERDLALSAMTGAPLHVANVSTAGALRAIRAGQERGGRASCGVTPHHFTLTDEQLATYDANFKTNPPLREEPDVEAMLDGLRDGTIDCISTAHAPHHYDEKLVEFDRAPFGVVGLETAVSICLDRLVHAGHVTLARLVELLAVNPARILGVTGGRLTLGAPADVTVLGLELPVTVNANTFRSLARNTPFDGWNLRGGVAATIVDGRLVYANEAVAGMATFAAALRRS